MELRSIHIIPGCWALIGRVSTGTQTSLCNYGTFPNMNAAAWSAGLLVNASSGGITYDAACHDPF